MDRLKALDGNLLQNWKSWRQDFILFMKATEYDEKPDNVKSSVLLHGIGEPAREGESDIELNESVEICRIVEVTRSQDHNFDEICRQLSNDQKCQKENPEITKKCKFCSFLHKRSSCPAYEKLCNNCKNKSQFGYSR